MMFSITPHFNFRNPKPLIAAKAAISPLVTTQTPPLSVIPRFMRGIQTTSWITRINRAMTNRWPPSLRGVQLRGNPEWASLRLWIAASLTLLAMTGTAFAATSIPFTINTSEAVNVTGTPRIAVDVGGVTRYATYTSGTGTNALTFTYAMVAGDVDLDGVTLSSPIDLNGGTLKDLNGNDATLTFTPPNTSNVKVNYPSLGMDFVADADGRYTLNGTVYNDLTSFLTAAGGTFTRASTATYFDSTGTMQTAASGTPRFDYDPVTHAAKGILIEEQRTNYQSNSGNLSGVVFGDAATTRTPNSTTSPIGSNTATKIIPATSTGVHRITGAYVANANTTATFSVYVKAAEYTKVRISLENTPYTGESYAMFDLSSGTLLSNGINGTGVTANAYSILPAGNSWYRISITGTVSGSWAGPLLWVLDNTGNPSFTGDGLSGIHADLWQIEQGNFPTSYIPTTTAAVTRQADLLQMPLGAWYNATLGTIFAESSTYDIDSTHNPGIISIDDNTTNNRIQLRRASSGSKPYIRWVNGGTSGDITTFTSNSWTGTTDKMLGLTYTSTTKTAAFSGLSTVSNTHTGLPSGPTTLNIGNNLLGGNYLNGHLKKAKYYPSNVTSTQLQLLTQ